MHRPAYSCVNCHTLNIIYRIVIQHDFTLLLCASCVLSRSHMPNERWHNGVMLAFGCYMRPSQSSIMFWPWPSQCPALLDTSSHPDCTSWKMHVFGPQSCFAEHKHTYRWYPLGNACLRGLSDAVDGYKTHKLHMLRLSVFVLRPNTQVEQAATERLLVLQMTATKAFRSWLTGKSGGMPSTWPRRGATPKLLLR